MRRGRGRVAQISPPESSKMVWCGFVGWPDAWLGTCTRCQSLSEFSAHAGTASAAHRQRAQKYRGRIGTCWPAIPTYHHKKPLAHPGSHQGWILKRAQQPIAEIGANKNHGSPRACLAFPAAHQKQLDAGCLKLPVAGLQYPVYENVCTVQVPAYVCTLDGLCITKHTRTLAELMEQSKASRLSTH